MDIDPTAFRRLQPGSPEHLHVYDHDGRAELRAAAVKTLGAQLHALLKPLGYERKGTTWRKASPFGRSLLQIQRGQHGIACYLNCGVRARGATGPLPGHFSSADHMPLHRLQEFYPDFPPDCRFDELHYVRLAEQANLLPMVVELVRLRALPWLELRHTPGAMVRMPTPADMAERIGLDGPGPRRRGPNSTVANDTVPDAAAGPSAGRWSRAIGWLRRP